MVKQRNLPFSFKPEQGSRVGLLPRGAADDSGMIWFDLPAHMVFHVANAYEEEDGTVKVTSLDICASHDMHCSCYHPWIVMHIIILHCVGRCVKSFR
jgi:carotenoid cleavage dioxygenase-like enzyme